MVSVWVCAEGGWSVLRGGGLLCLWCSVCVCGPDTGVCVVVGGARSQGVDDRLEHD